MNNDKNINVMFACLGQAASGSGSTETLPLGCSECPELLSADRLQTHDALRQLQKRPGGTAAYSADSYQFG